MQWEFGKFRDHKNSVGIRLMRTIGVGNHDSDSLDGGNLVLGNITAIPRTRGQ